MPREPRIYIEKVLYLVTAKGDEDRDLFSDSQDYNAYLKSLSEYKEEYGFKLFAYTLLPKSLYLLIELQNNVTISQIMHDLNSRYTKTYNSRYGKKGHLFQSRFKSILIEKDDYLLRISRYIHLLAKDAGVSDESATCRNCGKVIGKKRLLEAVEKKLKNSGFEDLAERVHYCQACKNRVAQQSQG